MIRLFHAIIGVCMLGGISSIASAQNIVTPNIGPANITGYPDFQTYDGRQEDINLNMGSMHLSIPLLDVLGRGSHNLHLSFEVDNKDDDLIAFPSPWNDSPLDQDAGEAWLSPPLYGPAVTSFHGGGISIPRLYSSVNFVKWDFYSQDAPTEEYCENGYIFMDEHGGKHSFPNAESCSSPDGNSDIIHIGYDGESGLIKLDSTHEFDDSPYDLVFLPDGTVLTFPGSYGGTLPTSSRDKNGNLITAVASGLDYSISDSIGRQITISNWNGQDSTMSPSIHYKDSNGVSQNISISYSTETGAAANVNWYNCGVNYESQGQISSSNSAIVGSQGTSTDGTLATIVIPTGAGSLIWKIHLNVNGEVWRVDYPNGGDTTYDYASVGTNYSHAGAWLCSGPFREVIAKHTCDQIAGSCTTLASTSYQPSFGCWGNMTNIVTDPDGTVTTHIFNDPGPTNCPNAQEGSIDPQLVYETDTAVVDTFGNPLRHIHYDYETSRSAGGFVGQAEPYGMYFTLPIRKTTTLEDITPNISFKEETDYQSLAYPFNGWYTQSGQFYVNQPVAVRTYDYGGSLLKTVSTARKSSSPYTVGESHILNLISQSTITGNHNDSFTTVYGYDEYPLVLSAAVQHDTTLGATRGNLTSVSQTGLSTPVIWRYYYDDAGNVVSQTDPNGNTTSFSYADAWSEASCSPTGQSAAFVTQIIDSLNHITSGQYSSCTGTIGNMIDPNGHQQTFTFDSVERLTLSQFDGAQTQQVIYNDANNTRQKLQYRDASNYSSRTDTFDGIGQLISSVQSDPSGDISVETTYDGMGRVISKTNPHRVSSRAISDGTAYTYYDGLGRITSAGEADQNAISYTYAGNTVVKQDEDNETWQYTNDALGRIITVDEFPQYTVDLKTNYTLDAQNHLLSVVQTGASGETPRSRSFTYDPIGRLVTAYHPETGTICYGSWSSGGCVGGYDANGNLLSKTDGAGRVVSYGYDALNRMTSKTRQGGSIDLYYYDGNVGQWAVSSNLGSNLVGRLSFTRSYNPDLAGSTCQIGGQGMCDDEYYGYDSMGRPNHLAASPPSEWGLGMDIVNSVYDLAGNLTCLTYPDGRSIHQTYDGAGRLYSVQGVSNCTTGAAVNGQFIASVSYLASNHPQGIVYSNGVAEHFVENTRFQLCQIYALAPVAVGGSMLYQRQIHYSSDSDYATCEPMEPGNNGNVNDIFTSTDPNLDNAWEFAYDGLNRLVGWYNWQGTGQSYNYDSFGNISTSASTNLPYQQVSFDPKNHLTSGSMACSGPSDATAIDPSNPGYDLAGNLLCVGTQNQFATGFVFDAESRVSRVEQEEMNNTYALSALYTYNAAGNRIRKDTQLSGTPQFMEYTSFNGQTLAEKDQNNNWTDYIYANGQKIARVVSSLPVFQFKGTRTGANLACGVSGWIDNAPNITIASGDVLSFDQRIPLSDTGTYAIGGIGIWVNNSGISLIDADGQPNWNSTVTDGAWHHRTFSIGQTSSGQVLTNLEMDMQNTTPTGDWEIDYANFAIIRHDGTTIPVFTADGGMNVTGWDGTVFSSSSVNECGSGNLTAAPVTIPVDPSVGTFYYLDDHLGTTQIELSAGGWPVWEGMFAPYGQELDNSATNMHYKFTGKERDTESGLDYFGARHYAFSMGRFISPDRSVDQHPEDPQSMNLYAYVRNNPLTHTDPTGMFDCDMKTSVCKQAILADFKIRQAAFDTSNPNMFAMQKVSDALGSYGDHNGVIINSADLGAGDASGVTGAQTVPNGLGPHRDGSTITFNSNPAATESQDSFTATLFHEGTHVVQNAFSQANFPSSFLGSLYSLFTATHATLSDHIKVEFPAYLNQGYMEQYLHIGNGQIYDPSLKGEAEVKHMLGAATAWATIDAKGECKSEGGCR